MGFVSSVHAGLRSSVLKGVALCLLCLAQIAESKKKKPGGRGNRDMEALNIIKWVLIGIFAPVALIFVYAIVRDPMTPHIFNELWCRAKETTGTFLNDKAADDRAQKDPKRSSRRPLRPRARQKERV